MPAESPEDGDIYYINAYTIIKRMVSIRIMEHLENPKQYGEWRNVGKFPEGFQFGSDVEYVPFASIPVIYPSIHYLTQAGLLSSDWSDLPFGNDDDVFEYLEETSKKAGLEFVKIVAQKNFPSGRSILDEDRNVKDIRGRVDLPNGRWFEYSMMKPFNHPAIEYMASFKEWSEYGGPEEGGWHYRVGYPTSAIPVTEDVNPEEVKTYLKRLLEPEEDKPGGIRIRNLAAVEEALGTEQFRIRTYEHFPEPFPSETPHYE